MMSVEPADTTKPKIRRRRDLLFAASKENTEYLPEQQKWEHFK